MNNPLNKLLIKRPTLNTLIMSRESAENFIYDKKYILISIITPHLSEANLKRDSNRVDLLRLEFNYIENKLFGSSLTVFNKTIAAKILKFVSKNVDKISTIVVHCDMGISRSSGVAYAITLNIISKDRSDIILNMSSYRPNNLVIKILNESFKELVIPDNF